MLGLKTYQSNYLLISPAASHASFSMDDQPSILNSTPIPNVTNSAEPPAFNPPAPVLTLATDSEVISSNDENNAEKNDSDNVIASPKEKAKAEKKAAKKLMKELTICKIILEEMEVRLERFTFLYKPKYFPSQVHEDSWPFLLPVNTKQFPTYKKIIKSPMDLSTIKKRLQDTT